MNTTLQPSRFFFAAALIALGVTGLANGDFALVWQSVPAHLPGRGVIAYVCAIIELALGIGLLWTPATTLACRVLFPYMVLWLVLLEVPGVIKSPLDAGAWGSIGEIGAMTAGAWCLFADRAGAWELSHLGFAVGPAGIRAARWLLVIALAGLAAEVIVDAMKFGDGVMQPWLKWLPHPAAWAVLTGVASGAACLALLFHIVPRLAATMEAAMIACIGVVYWAPDLHTGRTATTAFIITLLVSAGIWLVADTYRETAKEASGRGKWAFARQRGRAVN
ncbi:MAG: hypothetical protein ACREPY_13885 [Rhodanobacteraceae bacterium]